LPKEKRCALGLPHQLRDDPALQRGTVTLREARARPLQGTHEDQVMLRQPLAAARGASIDNRDEVFQVVTAGVIVMAASTEGLNLRPKEVRRGDSFELEGAGQFDGHSGVKRVGLPAAGQSKDRRVERHHVQH
jgi:hypothetical protein